MFKEDDRTNYIGGSDVGAILGFNPYRTPLDVYMEKVGEKKPSEENTFTYWGKTLERPIIAEFEYLTNLKVEEMPIKYHPDYSFIAGHIDGFIPEKNAILEIKTVGQNARFKWGDENHDLGELKCEHSRDISSGLKGSKGCIPESYLCQCVLYASIYNVDKVYIAVYFGNDLPLKIYIYERNHDLEQATLQALNTFWTAHVLEEIPPDPSTIEDLMKSFPNAEESTSIIATNEISDIHEKLQSLRDQKEEIEKEEEDLKKKLMTFMGEAESLVDITGNSLCTWKNISTNRFNGKAFKKDHPDLHSKYLAKSSSRRFLFKKVGDES